PELMNVRRQLADRKRVRLLAPLLAERMPATHMDWHTPLKIGQTKVHTPITAVRRAQEREQGLVLIDRQQLTIAQSPTFRRKTEAHDADFGKKRFSHFGHPFS